MLPERPRDDAVCVFLEAEEADVKLPFRRQYEGYAANFATMRLMPETPDEIEGSLAFTIPAARLHAQGRKAIPFGSELLPSQRHLPREPKQIARGVRGDRREDRRRGVSAGQAATSPGVSPREWCRFNQATSGLSCSSSVPGVEIDRLALYSVRCR
jgi:hypothetical protein